MLPYKEPSQVLMALMDKVVADGRQFAATADLNVSDMSAQAPVGTTLAILERVLKVTTAVQARIHFTMKQEFKLLAAIIRDNTPEDYDYDPESGDRGAKRSDYDMVNVLPVSDPNASTMAQRVVQYQAVIQLAQQAPQIYDLPYLHKQMIEILGVKNADKIIPTKDDMQPVDPISENMAMMNNKPVKAFMYQDHAAHLQVHMAMLHDPSLAQTMGQNPMAQQIMAALNAHIMEHVAYKYRGDIEHQLGVTLPPPPQSVTGGPGAALDPSQDPGYLDPQEEVKVSRLAALAAQQLLNNNQAQAQQQQIQQQMQDPIIQMQQQELQLKQQQLQMQNQQAQAELQIKQQQVQLESQVKQLEMQIKAQQFQLESQLKQGEAKRKAMKDVADAAAKSDDLELRTHDVITKHQIEGAKMGLEVAKHKAEQHHKGVELGVDVAKHRAEMHHSQLETGVDALKHMATMQHQKEQAKAAQEAQQQQQQSQESQQTEE
jgi:hypothetical protein